MRWHIILSSLVLFVLLTGMPVLATVDWKEGLTADWPTEDLHAWGENNLAVDFGPYGVWNYNGFWIQLSQWDSKRMEAFGAKGLAVDFGPHGLWVYDGKTWHKITR